MPHEKESRPGANRAANESINGDDPIITETWDEFARAVDGAFVVVVKTTAGRYRRRCWLTLAPAEKAASKAIEQGHDATVLLAHLKPLYRVSGGER